MCHRVVQYYHSQAKSSCYQTAQSLSNIDTAVVENLCSDAKSDYPPKYYNEGE